MRTTAILGQKPLCREQLDIPGGLSRKNQVKHNVQIVGKTPDYGKRFFDEKGEVYR